MSDYFDSIEYLKDSELPIFEGSEFIDCKFSGINLSGESLENTKFVDCSFTNCNLSNIIATNTLVRDSSFIDCKIVGVNWSSAQGLCFIKFINCILNLSVFQTLNLDRAVFEGSLIQEVDFSGSILTKASFNNSNLELSIFNECNLEEADFRDARNYQMDLNFISVKKAKFSMPEAMTLLESFDIVIE